MDKSRGSKPDAANDKLASNSKRKLVLAAPPILLGIANRPAWANMCSVSGAMSGPHSGQTEPLACLGCTPGFWKANPEAWPVSTDPGNSSNGVIDYTTGDCEPANNGNGNSTCKVWDDSGTKFRDIFDIGSYSSIGDITLMQLLWLGDKGNPEFHHALGAHIVAGLFNSSAFSEEYGYTATQFITMINDAFQGNFPDQINSLMELKDMLDRNNNRGCPINAHGTYIGS